VPLGIETFGQSGTISELYKAYGLDVDAVLGAVAGLLVGAARK
jgi:pyruvate dehydrogenase E1 component